MAVAIFLTYALQFYVPFEIIWKSVKHRFTSKPKTAEYSLRVGLVVGTGMRYSLFTYYHLIDKITQEGYIYNESWTKQDTLLSSPFCENYFVDRNSLSSFYINSTNYYFDWHPCKSTRCMNTLFLINEKKGGKNLKDIYLDMMFQNVPRQFILLRKYHT